MTSDSAAGGWLAAARVYLHPRVAAMLFLGFSAGLPFLLVAGTLTAWLKLADVSMTDIGLFALIGVAYSLKFLWAPLVDRVPLPSARGAGPAAQLDAAVADRGDRRAYRPGRQ